MIYVLNQEEQSQTQAAEILMKSLASGDFRHSLEQSCKNEEWLDEQEWAMLQLIKNLWKYRLTQSRPSPSASSSE